MQDRKVAGNPEWKDMKGEIQEGKFGIGRKSSMERYVGRNSRRESRYREKIQNGKICREKYKKGKSVKGENQKWKRQEQKIQNE